MFEEMLKLAGVSSDDPAAELGAISTQEIEEIRKMHHPPAVVRRTLEATFLLLNAAKAPATPAPPAWDRVQRMLSDSGFLARMLNFDASALADAPVLAAYVAVEYFDPEPANRKALPRRMSWTAGRVSGRLSTTRLDDCEPLTLKRVQRASHAVAAIFRWTAAVLVRASGVQPVTEEPPASAPEEPEEPEAAVEEPKEEPVPAEAPPAPEPALQPAATPPPTVPTVVPNGKAAPPAPPAPNGKVVPKAPVQAPQPKPTVPADAKPDRHFELLVPFELGSAALAEHGEEALQTTAATWLMRRRLQLRLISSPFEMENDALGAKRLNVAQEWLSQTGGLKDAGIVVVPAPRPSKADPGVICELRIDDDKVLRDFFLLTEQGEPKRNAGTVDTIRFAQWLDENFQKNMH